MHVPTADNKYLLKGWLQFQQNLVIRKLKDTSRENQDTRMNNRWQKSTTTSMLRLMLRPRTGH